MAKSDGLEPEGDRRRRSDRSEVRGEVDGSEGEGALRIEGRSGSSKPAQVENLCQSPYWIARAGYACGEKTGRAASKGRKEAVTHMSSQKPHDRFTSCFSPVNSSTCK
jgi:hypothetical protein